MTQSRIIQGDTEPIYGPVIDAVGNPVSSATVTIRIGRRSDEFFFDWDDNTFKNFASVGAIDQSISGVPNFPGYYRLNASPHIKGFNTAAITNVNADDTYFVLFSVTAPAGATGPEPIEIRVDQWLKDIRDAAIAAQYLGKIYVNANKGTNGIDPEVNGTAGLPVKTLAEALSISASRGTRDLLVVSGIVLLTDTLDDFFVTLRDESEMRFEGENINGSEFHGGFVKGAMVGTVEFVRARVEDVSGFNGRMYTCVLLGTTTLAINSLVTIHHCVSGLPGTATPTLKFAAGATCGIRGYNGGLRVEDMTDAANLLTIEFDAGKPIIDASCTAGTIEIRGTGEPIVDDSGPGCSVDTSGYLNAKQVWDFDTTIYMDGSKALAGEALKWLRQTTSNRMEVDFTLQRLDLYDDAATSIIESAHLADAGGGVVVALPGAPARRGLFT